jgi:hypothetical protein
MGFEQPIPVLERAKTVHALDRAATVSCQSIHILAINSFRLILVLLSCLRLTVYSHEIQQTTVAFLTSLCPTHVSIRYLTALRILSEERELPHSLLCIPFSFLLPYFISPAHVRYSPSIQFLHSLSVFLCSLS